MLFEYLIAEIRLYKKANMKTQLNLWLIVSAAVFTFCILFIIASYIIESNQA